MKKYSLATIIAALLLIANAAALHATPHIVAKQIPFFYQLPSNEIWTIYQDKEGFIWIGTTAGMARYDGYLLQSFRNDYRNPHLLTNNNIVTFSDNNKYVWIGTHSGLNLFSKHTWQISPCPEKVLQDKNIDVLIAGKQESMWVSAEGSIYHLNADGHIIRHYTLSKELGTSHAIGVNGMYKDRSGTLWAMLGNDGIARYNARTDTFNGMPYTDGICCFTMAQDHTGHYWIGTWGHGLWEYTPTQKDGKVLRPYKISDENGNEYKAIFSIVEDGFCHYLWMLAYNGAFCLSRQADGQMEKVNLEGIVDTYKMYTRIFKDREGNLWLSSYDKAYIVSFDDTPIDAYPLNQLKTRLGYDANIINMCHEEDGVLWISQDRFGLCLYDTNSDKLNFANKNGKGENYEVGIIRPSRKHGYVWVSEIGKDKTRIMHLKRQGLKTTIIDEQDIAPKMGNNAVNELQEDREGNLWILTSRGLACHNASMKNLLTSMNDVPSAMTTDNSGNVWSVNRAGDIRRLTVYGGSITRDAIMLTAAFKSGEKAINLCIDAAGGFWISTTLGNILHGLPGSKTLRTVNASGLTDGCTILKIIPSDNNVWIVTNNKLIRYNLLKRMWKSFFTSDDNMPVDLFRGGAAATDGKGGLFAGGHNGVVHIGAEEKNSQSECFQPMITDVRINGKSVFFDKPNTNESTYEKIFINPEDRNVELFISTLEYRNNPKRTIAYKLEGVDDDWTILPTYKHAAFYNNLKKGSYIFHLKYQNDNGQWVVRSQSLQIVRLPALYETWYAYTFYVALFMAIVWYGTNSYLRRLRRRNDARLKKEVAMARLKGLSCDEEDKTFLRQIMENIEKHIGESEYGIEQMAEELNVSKSTLHRRVKTISGLTPLDLIRSTKMKKAADLLLTTRRNISEIAYSLGFSNPKYFTKCFKDEYNETPTHYQQTHAE